MENIHYVYLTTNLVNGKQYIGDHTINVNKRKYYSGSGDILLSAIKKYGENNFFKEILEWFPTRKEAYEAQEPYIKKFNTLIPFGYNVSPNGGYGVNNSLLTEETKNKIRKANSGENNGMFHKTHTDEAKEIIRNSKIGTKASELTIQKYKEKRQGNNNPMYGTSFYKIWINKFGKEEADKKKINTIEKLSTSLLGLTRSAESISNYSFSAKNRIKKECPHCHKMIDPGNYKKYHGDKCKWAVETFREKNPHLF